MYGGLPFDPFSFENTLKVHCDIPSD